MNRFGNRTRQAATLSLLEYVADDLIEARKRQSAAQKRRAKKSRASGKSKKKNAREKRKPAARNRRATPSRRAAGDAVTFDGEDLMAIAARELGDVRRWREIADLNGIRDPRAVTIGQVLRLP
jgi:nucleoid-associated protein YgaU